MGILVSPPDGEPYEFEPVPDLISPINSESILQASTYPSFSYLEDVRTIVDVGANCGAASVFFAQHHPDAVVHAVEPGRRQRDLLERNARGFPNIVIHPIGLHDHDDEALLHHGVGDTGLNSLVRNRWHSEEAEPVIVRAADRWAEEVGIETIDILKVDVEMSELAVFTSLRHFLPEIRVIHFEYGSAAIRRGIHALIDPTHDVFLANMSLRQGECTYLRRDLAEDDRAFEHLVSVFVERKAAHKGR